MQRGIGISEEAWHRMWVRSVDISRKERKFMWLGMGKEREGGVEGEKGAWDSTDLEKVNVWLEEGEVPLIYTPLIGTRTDFAPEMHSTKPQHGRGSGGLGVTCVCVCVSVGEANAVYLAKAEVRGFWRGAWRAKVSINGVFVILSLTSITTGLTWRFARVRNGSGVTVARLLGAGPPWLSHS